MSDDFPSDLVVTHHTIYFSPARQCQPLAMLVALTPDDRVKRWRQEAAGAVIGNLVRQEQIQVLFVNVADNDAVLPSLHRSVPVPHLRPLCQQVRLEDGTIVCSNLQGIVWCDESTRMGLPAHPAPIAGLYSAWQSTCDRDIEPFTTSEEPPSEFAFRSQFQLKDKLAKFTHNRSCGTREHGFRVKRLKLFGIDWKHFACKGRATDTRGRQAMRWAFHTCDTLLFLGSSFPSQRSINQQIAYGEDPERPEYGRRQQHAQSGNQTTFSLAGASSGGNKRLRNPAQPDDQPIPTKTTVWRVLPGSG